MMKPSKKEKHADPPIGEKERQMDEEKRQKDEERQRDTSIWSALFGSGAIIAACSAVAFFLAFAKEYGFISKWGLPMELVKVNFSAICVVGMYVVFVIALVLVVYMILSKVSPALFTGKSFVSYALVFFMLLFSVLAFAFFKRGQKAAIAKRIFMTCPDRPNIVALRMYGGYVLCAEFNRETREMNGFIVIYKLDQITKEKWRGEEVGPLIPPKMKAGHGMRPYSDGIEK